MDLEALTGLGWDPVTEVLTPDPMHPVLGFPTCGVIGCAYPGKGSTGLCCGCGQKWHAQAMPELAAFRTNGVQRLRTPALDRLALCLVCRTPGHERPARNGRLCQCCQGRAKVRGQSVDAYIAGDQRFAPAVPRRSFGRCSASACRWGAESATGLCRGHLDKWAIAKRQGHSLSAWCASVPPNRGAKVLVFNLRGLNESVRWEFLLGLQAAVADCGRTPPSSMSRLIDYARSRDAGSLVELAGEDQASLGTVGGIALHYLAGELDVALATPDTEARKDSWNLRVFGRRTPPLQRAEPALAAGDRQGVGRVRAAQIADAADVHQWALRSRGAVGVTGATGRPRHRPAPPQPA